MDGSQRRIDDQELCVIFLGQLGKLLDLTLSEQGCRPNGAHAQRPRSDHLDTDSLGETVSLLDSRLRGAPRSLFREFGDSDYRALAARDLDRTVAVEGSQEPVSPSSSAACSSFRLSGCAG